MTLRINNKYDNKYSTKFSTLRKTIVVRTYIIHVIKYLSLKYFKVQFV